MNTLSLTFDQDHTHAGQPIKCGEIRDIDAHHADWLVAQHVAHLTPATPAIARKAQYDEPTGEKNYEY